MSHFFFIGWDPGLFIKYCKRKFKHTIELTASDEAHSELIESKEGYCSIVVWTLNEKPSTIVHECVHAANYSLGHAGVVADHDNDEPQAYLTELLFKHATGDK